MRPLLAVALLFSLASCGFNGTDRYRDEAAGSAAKSAAPAGSGSLADAMASHDGQTAPADFPDSEPRPIMQAQVVLDRIGFGPGVVDGRMGLSTRNALKGFQQAKGLTVTGELDEPTRQALQPYRSIPATRVVTIPAEWGQGDYYKVPDDAADKAKMKRLGYESLDERLAERFHTTLETLKLLNPGGRPAGAPAGSAAAAPAAFPTPTRSAIPAPTASAGGASGSFTPQPGPASVFAAGQQIRVPNIGGDRIAPGKVKDRKWQQTLAELGVGSDQPQAARVVVIKSGDTLKAYDKSDRLIALFTVSSGSSRDPLPLGEWKITGTAYNPPFTYNPELFWDVADSEEKQQLPPGPNGPVGVVWIDLSKEHYGIHGTPEPQTIGRAQSHGCVRLTNWDAARLAQMVSPSTRVIFEK